MFLSSAEFERREIHPSLLQIATDQWTRIGRRRLYNTRIYPIHHPPEAGNSQRARQKKTLARDDRKDHSPRDICCVVYVCPHLISGPFSRTTTISRCSRHILNCMTVFRNFSIYPKVSKDVLGTDQEQQQQLSFFLIPDRTTTHGPTCIFFFYVSLVMVIRR